MTPDPKQAAKRSDVFGWVVIVSYTGKVVTEYPTQQEAEDAAEWHQKTYGGPTLEVCRAR